MGGESRIPRLTGGRVRSSVVGSSSAVGCERAEVGVRVGFGRGVGQAEVRRLGDRVRAIVQQGDEGVLRRARDVSSELREERSKGRADSAREKESAGLLDCSRDLLEAASY